MLEECMVNGIYNLPKNDLKTLKNVLEERIERCDITVIVPHTNADYDTI